MPGPTAALSSRMAGLDHLLHLLACPSSRTCLLLPCSPGRGMARTGLEQDQGEYDSARESTAILVRSLANQIMVLAPEVLLAYLVQRGGPGAPGLQRWLPVEQHYRGLGSKGLVPAVSTLPVLCELALTLL